jgi:(1->4)-alpha-D-glucan 1-alpha-D-glucosylmutase
MSNESKAIDVSAQSPNAPSSTYRLQLSNHLSFAAVGALVDYFHRLGIGALYFSPVARAVAGSTHGYDIIDHENFDPTLGTDDDFAALAAALKANDIGLVIDVVPNHMGIDDQHNRWWRDVLTHGQCSTYAKFFDIDWNPPKDAMRGKVLLAVLGNQFGQVLEEQQLTLKYADGEFLIGYYEKTFPTDPRTWSSVLARVRAKLVADNLPILSAQFEALSSLIDALLALPVSSDYSPENVEQRRRLAPSFKEALADLVEQSETVRSTLEQILVELNGTAGDSRSFDALDEFLADQAYRLCYWRVATDEINYRRFFDVDTLAAIRVEELEVFDAVHAKILQAVAKGQVTGLRIDHADGLRDPYQYLTTLSMAAQVPGATHVGTLESFGPTAPYLIVEKILASDESLRDDWPVEGTTGYDLMNMLTRLLVDADGVKYLRGIYERFVGNSPLFTDILYDSQRTILATSLSSEIYVLSQQLSRIAEQNRWSRDFTRPALHRGLRELVACFPVYRTYVRPDDTAIGDEDRLRINEAVRWAKRRNPAMCSTFFDFIGSILLLEEQPGISDENRLQRREFVLKFQQITGPVMAKGMEDTAFYRFYPLASLNEVGGSPVGAPLWVEQFHERMRERSEKWPQSMSATATHDTKRGEDVRARLDVLSEVAGEWESAIGRWREMNTSLRVEVEGGMAPDANEEYLIYQTLVGTWPVLGQSANWPGEEYVGRIVQYMHKALREAKVHTSWLSPQSAYEEGVKTFVERMLDPGNVAFLESMSAFVRSIADAGFVNSLAQLILKIGVPGLPDFYQGCEFWDFNLVDPDNRRPVDFARRKQLLSEIDFVAEAGVERVVHELLPHWPDERIKMFATVFALRFRREHPGLFEGQYVPLTATGDRANHVCAFLRTDGTEQAIFVVPRFSCQAVREFPPVSGELSEQTAWAPAAWWKGVRLILPDGLAREWRNVFTGESLRSETDGTADCYFDVGKIFQRFPVAILKAAR